MQQTFSEVLTVEECAELLKVSPRTVYKLVSNDPAPNKIRARKVGRSWRIWREEVEQFLRHQGNFDSPLQAAGRHTRQARRPAHPAPARQTVGV